MKPDQEEVKGLLSEHETSHERNLTNHRVVDVESYNDGEKSDELFDNEEEETILNVEDSVDTDRDYKHAYRWVVFIGFCVGSFLNALVSMTYSSLPLRTEEYYPGVTTDEIDLLLNWAAILPAFLMFPGAWILYKAKNGMTWVIVVGTFLVALGCFLRLIPSLFGSEDFRSSFGARMFLHIGQAINACAFPLFMVAPSRLSAEWFPAKHRTTITAIAASMAEIGYALSFMIAELVRAGDSFEVLLYWELFGATACFVFCILLRPPRAPKSIRDIAEGNISSSGADDGAIRISPELMPIRKSFCDQFRDVMKDRNALLLAITGGLVTGSWIGWSHSLTTLLTVDDLMSEESAEYIGFVTVGCSVLGSLMVGIIADTYFTRRFLRLIVYVYIGCLVSQLWLTMVLPYGGVHDSVIHHKMGFIIAGMCIAGFFQGAMIPLCYELLADISFPVPEGVSASFYQFVEVVVMMILLLISPLVATESRNILLLVAIVLTGFLIPFIKEHYHRLDALEDSVRASLSGHRRASRQHGSTIRRKKRFD